MAVLIVLLLIIVAIAAVIALLEVKNLRYLRSQERRDRERRVCTKIKLDAEDALHELHKEAAKHGYNHRSNATWRWGK